MRLPHSVFIAVCTLFFTVCPLTASGAHPTDALPSASVTPTPDFSVADLIHTIEETPLHRIEGIWQVTSDGAEIAILRSSPQDQASATNPYRIIIINSPNRAIRPGTIAGLIGITAKPNEFDGKIYTKSVASKLIAPKKFRLTLDAETSSRLTVDKKRSSVSFSPWRLIPYSWRLGIRKNTPEPSTSGFIRIFPAPPIPSEPVYL